MAANQGTPGGTGAQQIIDQAVKQGADSSGNYEVSDSAWARVLSYFRAPRGLDTITPLQGPYAGDTFVPQKTVKGYVRPGLPAAAAATGGAFGFNFSAITDFLNYVGWILHPLNWLRMVEFVTGMIFSLIGIALLAKSGSRSGVTARSVVRTIPGGRVALNHRRGAREAREQREVNEGRQQWKINNP